MVGYTDPDSGGHLLYVKFNVRLLCHHGWSEQGISHDPGGPSVAKGNYLWQPCLVWGDNLWKPYLVWGTDIGDHQWLDRSLLVSIYFSLRIFHPSLTWPDHSFCAGAALLLSV